MLRWFSYFLIALKTGSVILGLVLLSPTLNVYVEIAYDFTENVLKVSGSSTLFAIVLLHSFNILHSLWKAFSEKRGLTVFRNQ